MAATAASSSSRPPRPRGAATTTRSAPRTRSARRAATSSIYLTPPCLRIREARTCAATRPISLTAGCGAPVHALWSAQGTRDRQRCRSGWVRRRMLAARARQRCLLPGSAVLTGSAVVHSSSHARNAGRQQPLPTLAPTLSRARRSRAMRTRARRRSPPTARWASPTPAAPPAPATARLSLAPPT